MDKIKVAIVGYGNIGRYAVEAVNSSPDMELVCVVRRNTSGEKPLELANINIVDDISKAGKVDVALLCTPTRSVEENAVKYLEMGINTVDSYDIHTSIVELRQKLDASAKKGNAVAILSAGWDPGSDSVVRTLMEAMAPKGITYTNFGPGMSMGHSVCAKGMDGVVNALSMTIPLGTSVHRRMVYVQLENGADINKVTEAIKSDPYFSHDETHVIQVPDIDALLDMGHGVNMIRKGVSGETQNQLFEFNMKINNPALTSQVMVACARASMKQLEKQNHGAYTMIEIPVIDLLFGEKEELIKKLV